MKKILLALFSLFLALFLFLNFPNPVNAQLQSTSAAYFSSASASVTKISAPAPKPSPVKKVLQAATTTQLKDGAWVGDSDVTFVGKMGARSGQFLDWTLQNYDWSFVAKDQQNPLVPFWVRIRDIVYIFSALFVLITAFIMIVTRGKNITIKRFVPRFVFIILLVTFSYALIQFIYQAIDAIQGFFLSNPDFGKLAGATQYISQKNLLNIGFKYEDFIGYRKYGAIYDESAFISLLLVKLTAVTYYTMSGILLLRKIILWFFIIISPIFPLLLFYSPIRNTAKIWVGEFFRWLLYAPLFAIFLRGLVEIWRTGIPLIFGSTNASDPTKVIPDTSLIYPTAINILLGGPGQILSLTNSVNNKNTFALYIVALIMLWVVIILPFLLLQIFLDYLNTLSIKDNNFFKQLYNSGSSFMFRGGSTPTPSPSPAPSSYQPAGMARNLPFTSKISIPEIQADKLTAQTANFRQASSDIMRLTSLSVPTMRDIAKYETSALSSDISRHAEIAKVHETLESIANPNKVGSLTDRQRFASIKTRLSQEGQKGNSFAAAVLTAASTVSKSKETSVLTKEQENQKLSSVLTQLENPETATPQERQKLSMIKNQLIQAQQGGDTLAGSILAASKNKTGMDDDLKQKLKEAKEKGNSIAATIMQEAGISEEKLSSASNFPVVNRVQSVSLDDYEAVKKLWVENYQTLEPPAQRKREEWVKADVEKISQTITLLTSIDPQNVSRGMESVATILPFLLIGGFSQTEVIAYLKAKLEAAKTVLGTIETKEEEEETTLSRETHKEEKPKEMTAQAEALLQEEKKPDQVANEVDNNKSEFDTINNKQKDE